MHDENRGARDDDDRMASAAVDAVGEGHVPVLLAEVLDALAPASGRRIVDATFGGGGYARAFLAAGADVVAFDRDPDAIARGRRMRADEDRGGRLLLVEAPFARLREELAARDLLPVDAVVFDLGVSSFQLDEADRGFSFRREGPLDMRMGRDAAMSAAEIVNEWDEARLARLIGRYGEEPAAGRIARAIVRARARSPISTTRALADIVADAVPPARRHGRIHPATRTFQALRMAVNDELGQLRRGLAAAEHALRPGGRLAVVSFHSLEDRIVKRFLAERAGRAGGVSRHRPQADDGAAPTFRLLAKRAIRPGEAEIAANPRARSARLRVAERLDAPARVGRDRAPDEEV